MEYSTLYNPNFKSSSSSSIRTSKNTRNGKKKGCNNNNNNDNNNNNKGEMRLSTDPQSIAARERRHRISNRFKMLRSLVPGGAKLDTVSMLEQAIQYVKFLKAQICFHESLIKNNNTTTTTNNNYNDNDNDGVKSCTNINNSATTNVDDNAYYYDDNQYYYALMYDCNNYINQLEGGGAASGAVGGSKGGFDGGFCNLQEMNMAPATPSQEAANYELAAQIQDGWNYYQEIDYKRSHLNYY